jgi:hypothetical protein
MRDRWYESQGGFVADGAEEKLESDRSQIGVRPESDRSQTGVKPELNRNQTETLKSRRAWLREVFLSVDSLRVPIMRAQFTL